MRLLLLSIGLLSLSSFSASSQDEFTACYSCTSAEMRDAALRASFQASSPEHTVRVVNLKSGQVLSYFYSETDSGTFGPSSYTQTLVSTPSTLSQAGQEAKTYVENNSGFLWPPGKDNIHTAFDFVLHSQNEQLLDDWLNSEHLLFYRTTNLISLFGGARFDVLRGIPFEVKFEDGSSIVFKSVDSTSAESTRFTISVIEDSARDADGNSIAHSREEFVGFYTATEGTIDTWIDYASRFGIEINRVYSSTGSTEAALEMDCRYESSTRIVCTIRSSEESINPS